MDPLNDLVWADEDENESGVMPTAIDGPPMPQICNVSEAQCSGDPGSGGGGDFPLWSGTLIGDYIGCGC